MTEEKSLECLSLEALAARCEGEEPSAELDVAIHNRLGIGDDDFPLDYTTSLDAALTLVPELWNWTAANRDGMAFVWLGHRKKPARETSTLSAKTPALALCAAALKARAIIAGNVQASDTRPKGNTP